MSSEFDFDAWSEVRLHSSLSSLHDVIIVTPFNYNVEPDRRISRIRPTLYTGGSDGFVAFTAAPIATGWNEQFPGGNLNLPPPLHRRRQDSESSSRSQTS